MELYPIRFSPIYKEKIWGGSRLKTILNKKITSDKIGESWEISAVQDNISLVENGFLEGNTLEEIISIYMGELVGEKIYEKFGIEFPLLFKFIDANDKLSIQVHPDNDLAKQRHQAYGKTEMWYVINAENDAEIIVGFNKEIDKYQYTKAVKENTLIKLLNKEKVKKSDAFYIPSGRVHAIGKGVLLAEIQQTSDITYRIYDWDRKDANGQERELHTEWALDAIDYKFYKEYKIVYEKTANQTNNLVDSPYFTTNLLQLDKAIETDYNSLDSFVVYMCVEGAVEIKMRNSDIEILKKGESILIPAIADSVQLNPLEQSDLLEVFIKPDKIK
jgi:mannose-6-phosphate isomerase